MNINGDYIGSRVIARYAQGDERARGEVVAYCPVPSVMIRTDGGAREWWRADMCEPEDSP